MHEQAELALDPASTCPVHCLTNNVIGRGSPKFLVNHELPSLFHRTEIAPGANNAWKKAHHSPELTENPPESDLS